MSCWTQGWAGSLLALGLGLAPLSARAELPALLRTENAQVREGNEKLQKGDAKGALGSYDQAARGLPDSPGVQLNRGLALLKAGELPKARETLLSATQPSAPPALRADAYHNLALAFYREGDQLAGQKNHKEAQQRFRESVDAGKRALRLRPGDASVAWNLELAARRVREEEEKQKEEEQKQKDEQKDDDQQKQDQPKDDQQKQDQDPKDQEQKDEDQAKQDEPKPDPKGDEPPKQDQAKQDKQGKDKGEPDQPKPQEPQGEQAQEPELPAEAEQALDALSDGEENFERYRARQRASRERRAPEKDW